MLSLNEIISHLQSCRAVHNDLGRVLQSPASSVFSLGSDHFSSGLSGSLSLSSHGSHQLGRDPDVLHLHPLHLDTPWLRCLIQCLLHRSQVSMSSLNPSLPSSLSLWILSETESLQDSWYPERSSGWWLQAVSLTRCNRPRWSPRMWRPPPWRLYDGCCLEVYLRIRN